MKKTPSRIWLQLEAATAHISEEKIAFFQHELKRWYREHGRHFPWREQTVSPFHFVLSEILLHRTRAEAVAKIYPIIQAAIKDWPDILNIDPEELTERLNSLGLARSRVVTLRSLAKAVIKQGGVAPGTREELESLPGVGQYIASAILVGLHGQMEPLLDVNMARVLERFFGPRKFADIRDDPYLQGLARKVLDDVAPLEFNWAILDFAAKVCQIRKPLCEQCPVASQCHWFTRHLPT